MTIVAVMKESEASLLLAADSQFTAEGTKKSQSKLRQIPNQQIAWSCAGNPSIGLDEFGDWLTSYDFAGKASKGWRPFIDAASKKLSQLNGAQRERTRLSRAEWNKNLVAEVLIAGWLNNKLGAYVLCDDGVRYDVLRENFDAIGTGRAAALAARSVVKSCKVDLDEFTTLKIVIEAVAVHVQDCCSPIEMWRIKRDKIEKVL